MFGLDKFRKEEAKQETSLDRLAQKGADGFYEKNQGLENAEFLGEEASETNLPNLEAFDLERLRKTIDLKESITGRSFDIYEEFQKRLSIYLREIAGAYSEEDLRKTVLVNVLKGEDIPQDAEHLDLEGEYSVQEFLQGIVNELDEETI